MVKSLAFGFRLVLLCATVGIQLTAVTAIAQQSEATGTASSKKLAPLVHDTPRTKPVKVPGFRQGADDLYRIYVVNSSNLGIWGMVIDGKNQFFNEPIPRTCSTTPEACAEQDSMRRLILIQGCKQSPETIALIYKETDGQFYAANTLNITPNCIYGGAVIAFGGG